QHRGHRKHHADQSLRQHIQRTARRKSPAINPRTTKNPGAPPPTFPGAPPPTFPCAPPSTREARQGGGIARGSAREMLSVRSLIAKRWGIARGSAREMLTVPSLTSDASVCTLSLSFLCPPETPQRRRDPQTHHRIRNRDPRKDKDPKARQQNQRRIHPRVRRPEHPPCKALAHQRQRQHRKRQRQPHRN